MARSYYSMVVDRPAEAVWQIIRPFDHYAWAGVPGETTIQDGKRSDQVSAVRIVDTGGGRILRQKLLAHSDLERSYTYAFDGPAPFPVWNYVATIRVAPVGDGAAQAFVEWWATFDCAPDELARRTHHFAKEGFAKWLAALKTFAEIPSSPV
ncbi:MAG TPA: SRPBCC family protein [Reyranella sp.]|nr:SRPBCC family protein [Reyranella sp.]